MVTIAKTNHRGYKSHFFQTHSRRDKNKTATQTNWQFSWHSHLSSTWSTSSSTWSLSHVIASLVLTEHGSNPPRPNQSNYCTFIGVKPVATFTAYFKFAFCSQQAGWWPEVPGVAEMTLYKGTIMISTMIDPMIRVMMETVMPEDKQLAPISPHRQFSNSWNVFTAGKNLGICMSLSYWRGLTCNCKNYPNAAFIPGLARKEENMCIFEGSQLGFQVSFIQIST